MYAFLMVLLFVVFAGRVGLTWRVFNDTMDENIHVAAGVEMWERGMYSVEAQHPPVARAVLGALPYWIGGLRAEGRDRLWREGPWSKADPETYWRWLALARAGNLLFAAVAYVVVWAWSTQLYGKAAGLLAGLVFVCCPNLTAHAGLATLDSGAAATTVLAAYCLWRWTREPNWKWTLGAAGATSLAVLVKFSAITFLAPLAVFYWALAGPHRLRLRAVLPAAAAVFLAMLWTAYLFQAGRPEVQRYTGRPPNRIEQIPVAGKLVPYMFGEGLAEVFRHNRDGHRAYLLGEISMDGWWYYFPVAVALKTTLPLLALALVGVAAQRRSREMLYPAVAVVVILAVAMTARLNIGLRHVLGVYPLLAVLAREHGWRVDGSRESPLLCWQPGTRPNPWRRIPTTSPTSTRSHAAGRCAFWRTATSIGGRTSRSWGAGCRSAASRRSSSTTSERPSRRRSG